MEGKKKKKKKENATILFILPSSNLQLLGSKDYKQLGSQKILACVELDSNHTLIKRTYNIVNRISSVTKFSVQLLLYCARFIVN